jgi:serine/threonine protein kinase
MPLTAGARLGPYEIVGPLGSGGMGEVYRARDTRLERTVAIKVMPAHLAADQESRERFEREARVISSLDHPNICALYDVGRLRADGAPASQGDDVFLVMQYLEGETLADRITRGPLPIDELLRYGIEIASALDAAHRAGVVHRDLKPGNVMLTPTGARLLDFGLAKSGAAAITSASGLAGPTIEQPLTAQGTILGTFQYMSPEQVEGKDADYRTDIFSLGCVLYEMATSRKPFSGSTPASLIGAILHVDPPSVSTARAQMVSAATSRAEISAAAMVAAGAIPPAFDRLVRKSLAKNPSKRWQSAADLGDELRWIAEARTTDAGPASVESRDRRPAARGRERIAWTVAALGVLAALAMTAWLVLRPAPRPRVIRAALPIAGQLGSGIHTVAISPQGTHVAYVVTRSGGGGQLFVRAVDQMDATPVRGAEDALQPFFSPDGQWIGFFGGAKLKKVAITGGTPLTLCDATVQPRGGAWGPDGTIVFSAGSAAGLSRISANGGTPQVLTTPDQKAHRGHRWPSFLAGNRVLFSMVRVGATLDNSHVGVLSLDTNETRVVFEGGNYPRYSPTGHLLVTRGGALLAVPFDAAALAVKGGPVPVVEAVAMSTANGASQFAVSDSGALIYVTGDAGDTERPLVLADRKGGITPLLPSRAYKSVRYSPDGRRLALRIEEDIWVHHLARQTTSRLTVGSVIVSAPVWTPDGNRMIFSWNALSIVWKPSDGSGAEEPLVSGERPISPSSVSRDGQFLAYTEVAANGSQDIWVVPLNGDRKPRAFVQTPLTEEGPVFSPDGKWIAYQSNVSGQPEIYVEPFPGPGGKFQVSVDGGSEPHWTADGRELIFRRGPSWIAAATTLSPTFTHGTPRELFQTPFFVGDVAPDGKQFALVQQPSDAAVPSTSLLHLVVNWFEELKEKLPAR